jgi:hypothetical protein
MASYDQGNALPLALGTAITNAYNANTTGAAMYGSLAGQVDVFLTGTTLAGSPITSVTVKCQVRYDVTGSNWFDIQTKRHDTNTTNVEHVLSLGAAPQSVNLLLTTNDADGALGGFRVLAHADATGIAGDVIAANVTFA